MDISAYIASGILESYCLDQLTEKEKEEVEQYAELYPEISAELKQIYTSLVFYSGHNSIVPHASVKVKLMLKIYEQESGPGKKYPPLVNEHVVAGDFRKWLAGMDIEEPAGSADNLYAIELPSTDTVTNFLVWAKEGHQEEVHTSYNEFIVVLRGHCDMFFNGMPKHYAEGDIIVIPPGIQHHAVVTSPEPMFALVQRQLLVN